MTVPRTVIFSPTCFPVSSGVMFPARRVPVVKRNNRTERNEPRMHMNITATERMPTRELRLRKGKAKTRGGAMDATD